VHQFTIFRILKLREQLTLTAASTMILAATSVLTLRAASALTLTAASVLNLSEDVFDLDEILDEMRECFRGRF